MSNQIILKKSSVGSKVPLVTDLAYGELALNYADGKLYFKNSSNQISSFSASAVDLSAYATLTGSQTLTNKTLTSPALTTPSVTGLATFTTTTAANAVNITYNPSATTGAALSFAGSGTQGGTNYLDFIKVTNSAVGATNANKSFRLDSGGSLQIINSAYSTNIFNLTDAGTLSVPAISAGGTTGTSGQFLQSTGSGLQWASPAGGGTVLSVVAGSGLTGGTITSSGTIAIDTSVVATLSGTQTLTNKTISGAANTLTAIPNSALTNSSVTIGTTTLSLGASSTTLTGLTSVTSTTFVGALTGNATTATTATALATARTIALTGDVTYTSAAFDGSANVTGTATLASVGTAGTYTKVTTDAKGRVTSGTTLAAADIPSLDASKITSGTIDAARLPSFVDDVIEGANLAAFPATGETGKIYVALDTNKTYRWSGSVYVYITSGAVDSVAGKTGVVTLVKGDVGLGNVDNTADSTKSVASAAILTTTRNVNGVPFNGSADITITAVNPNALTIGAGLTGTSYTGSSAVTIAIDSTVATLTGTQTLTNKTLTSPTINSATANNLSITGTLNAGGGVGTNGQVLVSTGAGVQWSSPSGGALANLSDVYLSTPRTQQVLTYNGTQWVNADSNAVVASAVFASSQYDMGLVTDGVITVREDEGTVAGVTNNIYDLGVLSFTGIISLNNIDQSVKSDYLGYSIIFGF